MATSSQTTFLLLISFGGFLFLTLIVLGHRIIRICGPWSARFVTVNASTNLSKKLNRTVESGVEILIPAGNGRYPLVVSKRWLISPFAKFRWEKRLDDWIRRGATIKIIVTSPHEGSVDYWQSLVNKSGPQLKVYLLNRKFATDDDAREITRLDTFHPILVHKEHEPLGMWIEAYHPLNSAVAYNVQFTAKKDIVGVQLERFNLFYKILCRLIDENSHPKQVQILFPDIESQTNASGITQAA